MMKVIMLGHTSKRGSFLISKADHAWYNNLDCTQVIYLYIHKSLLEM